MMYTREPKHVDMFMAWGGSLGEVRYATLPPLASSKLKEVCPTETVSSSATTRQDEAD